MVANLSISSKKIKQNYIEKNCKRGDSLKKLYISMMEKLKRTMQGWGNFDNNVFEIASLILSKN